jgi:hypothetical protein
MKSRCIGTGWVGPLALRRAANQAVSEESLAARGWRRLAQKRPPRASTGTLLHIAPLNLRSGSIP